MDDIPVSFEYEGRQYHGSFSEVFGVGRHYWHLMVDNRYLGRIRLVDADWYFDGALQPDETLLNYFAAVIIAWYE